MGKLEGKSAIVSGSGRGIGRSIALKLAADGAKVVVNDLDLEPAEEVVEEIRKAGGTAELCAGNVTAPDFGDRFVKTAVDAFGGLDIVVNNAGYTWDSVIQKMTDEQFQAMLDVHLMAPFRILRAAAGPMRDAAKKEAKEGLEVFRKVVNISSISGTRGNAGQVNYAAAKAGLIGMTKALCREWGRYKINVNAVAYGSISTRMTKALGEQTINIEGREIAVGVPQQSIDTIGQIVPVGRSGTTEEAADAVYLFCIPESNYVSGEVTMCSGGLF